MEIKAIYKIRAWVNKRERKYPNSIVHPYSYDEVVVNNIDTARSLYDKQVQQVKSWEHYPGHTAHVQLFIPRIFDTGQLAYWPDNEEYIEQYEF